MDFVTRLSLCLQPVFVSLDVFLEKVDSHAFLGVHFCANLKWDTRFIIRNWREVLLHRLYCGILMLLLSVQFYCTPFLAFAMLPNFYGTSWLVLRVVFVEL